jgi:lipid-A-disaccharide synthase
MPNLLLGKEVYPELIQDSATPQNIAEAAIDLLTNEQRRSVIKADLEAVIASLGTPGATERAADAVLKALKARATPLRAHLH